MQIIILKKKYILIYFFQLEGEGAISSIQTTAVDDATSLQETNANGANITENDDEDEESEGTAGARTTTVKGVKYTSLVY